MNYNIDNLRFVFFTNECNIHLIKLTLKYFFKYNNLDNIKISVISNNYNNVDDLPFKDKVEYLSGNVKFGHNGQHFSESLKCALPNIKEDYIFFFCVDYFFVSNTRFDDLEKLMSIIVNENIDYFGFSFLSNELGCEWKPFVPRNSSFPDDYFYYIDNKYRYLYSVQPTIWKKNSLLELANTYNFSLHELDETLSVMKTQNTFKCVAKNNKLPNYVNTLLTLPENYFIISYCEIVRHGVFYHPLNGFHLDSNWVNVKFIDKLVQEENLTNNIAFKKLLHAIK